MYLKPVEVVEKYNVSKHQLLEWEKKGLIKPFRTPGTDTQPGHRRYNDADVRKLLGLPSEIEEAMGIEGEDGNLEATLRKRLAEGTKEEIDELIRDLTPSLMAKLITGIQNDNVNPATKAAIQFLLEFHHGTSLKQTRGDGDDEGYGDTLRKIDQRKKADKDE